MDKKIIHVDNQPFFGEEVAKEVVHECLEGSRGVAHAEEHYGGSKSPKGVIKAAFHQFSGLMRMLLYLHHILNLVKIEDLQTLSTRSEMSGRG